MKHLAQNNSKILLCTCEGVCGWHMHIFKEMTYTRTEHNLCFCDHHSIHPTLQLLFKRLTTLCLSLEENSGSQGVAIQVLHHRKPSSKL